MDFQAMRRFVENNYLRNRTINTSDIAPLLKDLETTFDLPVHLHRYQSGENHGTWVVPEEWNVRSSWIKDSYGKTIASYDEHPLFVSPYSSAVETTISKKDLEKHVVFDKNQPNAFAYNWRLAYDPKIRLKDWSLSIPYERWQKMEEGSYRVFIDTEAKKGEMLIGEVTVPGKSKETIVFLADYCHPGQVNDSFSGVALFMEVMKTLSLQKKEHYTYSLLVLPETIGPCIYLASKSQGDKNIVGAVFADNVAFGDQWCLQLSRKENSYMNLLAQECAKRSKDLELVPFMGVYGDDERIFDSPQVHVPTLALHKHPCPQMHTSNDNMACFSEENLKKAYEIILNIVDVCEGDCIYQYVHNVPFHMSRFNLFADFDADRENFEINRKIVDSLDGETSLLDIALKIGASFSRVESYTRRMLECGLLKRDERLPLRYYRDAGKTY